MAGTLDECLAVEDVVFDVAVPPDAAHDVLSRLPDGAAVLIQKPLGRDFSEAGRIRDLCRRKGFAAAVNLQLRFSPMMLALADAIQRGVLGEIVDLEVRLACATPWQLWPFMSTLSSVEVPMHSIHYIDWIRSLLGTPERRAVAVAAASAAPHSCGRPDDDDPRLRPPCALRIEP